METAVDHAVGLVQVYLRINGYFTVSEYPVIVPSTGGGYRSATDLDILAVRFPRAGHRGGEITAPGGVGSIEERIPDPVLGVSADHPDMLIGEVKEDRAELNRGAADLAVVEAALRRFGCCDQASADRVARELRRRGQATLPNGHPVRLVAFGSAEGDHPNPPYLRITHAHILGFLGDYVRQFWAPLHVAEAKDAALGFLLLQEKARRGAR